jgi:hypothetical protein
LREKSQPASAPVSVQRSRAEPRDVAGYVDCDNFA